MRSAGGILFAYSLFVVLVFTSPATAVIIRVPDDTATIQAAIDSSSNGDTVLVDTGRYVENIDFSDKNIVVGSLFLVDRDTSRISRTIIDGNQQGSVITFPNGNHSSLTGFTVVNGEFPYGGGVLCDGSSPRISYCIFRNNRAESTGGAIYSEGAEPRISYCIFSHNFAYFGGAVATGLSDVVISNSTFSANSAVSGGAISNYYSQTTLINCILWKNYPEELSYHTEDITVAYSDVNGGWTGEGNIDADPMFVDDGNTGFHLQDESPCIDAGTAQFVWEGDTLINLSPDDYDGNAPDMGAFESPFSVELTSAIAFPGNSVLHRNFPNPFNPATTIGFSLPQDGLVNLTIYDLLGREVQSILSQHMPAGRHTLQWNAGDVPSGVYIIRMEAGDPSTRSGQGFTQTRKMVLME